MHAGRVAPGAAPDRGAEEGEGVKDPAAPAVGEDVVRRVPLEMIFAIMASKLIPEKAVGQVTPGPVFTTATFIGYVLGGVPGAAVATVGIFLPAFFFVAVSGPLIPRIRRSEIAGAFLDGINATSMALMAVVTFDLGQDALADFTTIGIGIVSAILLFRLRVNSAWLVLGGAMAGMILRSRV